jgi:predicted ATPase/transcriptional regulator with XRE-family HTH domain
MDDASFGATVRRRRKALDLTQDQLAELAGCAGVTIRKIESNERRPSRDVAERLAAALAIPPAERAAFVRAARLLAPEPAPPPALPAPPAPPPEPDIPPLRPRSGPLPALLGRETELAVIGGLLSNPICRLVTLVGPGGVGKTRLAEATAAALAGGYRDGARVIALAPVARPELLAATLAGALGVPLRSQSDAAERLIGALRERALLLVLDNLEHLLDGVVLLNDILAAAPGVQILATSRERLGLSHEWVLDVRGLSLPADVDDPAFEQAGAAALFLQAASRLDSGFRLAPADRPALLQICRLADGMPLALELAAAWSRALSLPEIAAEIGRSLDILTSSARDAPARHRSLRAVFDSSWEQLDPAEQRALRRLAVFRGGFTRAGAEAVAEAGLPALAALQSKSLLRRAAGEDGRAGRYSLHELVRQYAEERLRADQAEDRATRDRHSAFALQLMDERAALLYGAEGNQASSELRGEADNIRAAWQHLVERGDIAQIARYSGGMIELLDHLDWYEEGLRTFRAGAERLGRLPAGHPDLPLARGRMLMGQGLFSFRLGRYVQAHSLLSAALELARAVGEEHMLASCLNWLGTVDARTGRYLASRAPLEEAYELYLRMGNIWGAAFTCLVLSNALQAHGDYPAARALLERSIELMRGAGDEAMVGYYQVYLANLLAATGEHGPARAILAQQVEAMTHARVPNDRDVVLGRCAYQLGDYELARELLERTLAVQRAHNEAWVLTRNLTFLGQALAALGDERAAARHLVEALRLGQRALLVPRVLDAVYGLAELLARRAAPADAAALLAMLIEHPASWHETRERAARLLGTLAAQPAPCPPTSLDALVDRLLSGELARM